MGTTVIGDPNKFAIEYELQNTWPPFGRVRLWLDGIWFGDIQRKMFLYHMASMLKAMASRKPSAMRLVYESSGEVPPDDELLAGVSWSWGDSFDDFLFVLYAVELEKVVHVLWKLEESRTGDFPGYPLGPHHARVPYTVFDGVVKQFLDAIGIP